jgi:calcium-dependent protein kinase
LQKALEVMDSNNNGKIDYTEFIAASMASKSYMSESHLKQAFLFFDKDGSGTISRDELRECL